VQVQLQGAAAAPAGGPHEALLADAVRSHQGADVRRHAVEAAAVHDEDARLLSQQRLRRCDSHSGAINKSCACGSP